MVKTPGGPMTKRAPNRNRHVPYSIRFSPEERERAAALRERTGLPLSALIRRALFDTPLPRAARRPTVNHKAVAQLLGELGKIGGNLNQAQKHINAGHPQWNVWEEAARALIDMRTACMEALGREQDRKPPEQ